MKETRGDRRCNTQGGNLNKNLDLKKLADETTILLLPKA